jgi:hypothetical protein
MRVLLYLPANLIKGVLFEGVIGLLEGTITPSKSTPFMRFAGRYHNTLIKYSLYEVCWKVP